MRFIISKGVTGPGSSYRLSIRNTRSYDRYSNKTLGTFDEALEARNFLANEYLPSTKVLWFGDPTEIEPFYIGYTEDDLDLDMENAEQIFGPRIWAKRPNRGMQNRGKST